jgi:hypothetical protein
MVSWKERYPFLARHHNQLLQKIHKTQEEWDKLWDLLLLLQYPGESWWGWEEGTTAFQFPTSSWEELKKKCQEECRRQLRRASLPPNLVLQAPPPPKYPMPDEWKLEKRKASYPAQGARRQRSCLD